MRDLQSHWEELLAIVDGELFGIESDDGPFMTVFPAAERLRLVIGTTKNDEQIASIDLDEVSVGRLRRAIDQWLASGRI
jgi:hypothetical protein